MHTRATYYPTSTSVEVEKRETDIWIFWKSKDRMPEEKKRKKSSKANTQDDINAKGASDRPTADEPAVTEKTDFFIGTTA